MLLSMMRLQYQDAIVVKTGENTLPASMNRRYCSLGAQDGQVRQEAYSLQTIVAVHSCTVVGRNDDYALTAGVLDGEGLVLVAAAYGVLIKS